MALSSRHWRWIVDSVAKSTSCAPALFCQSWVAEVQLRDAASQQWVANTGTAARSIVAQSSGDLAPELAAWKAADGVLTFDQAGGQVHLLRPGGLAARLGFGMLVG